METSIPQEFREKMSRVSGIDADRLLLSLDTPPGVSIRFNTRKARVEEMEGMYSDMRGVEWCKEGRRLKERPVFTLNPLLHGGVFYVQDASSMIYSEITETLVRLIEAERGERSKSPLRVLDFCAAPGGKTTAIINALPEGAEVVANEYEPKRGRILRENLEKWGYGNVIMTGSDAQGYTGVGSIFDIVAVDAPCSGEGMMRKEEESRRQWSEGLVRNCSVLQREILSKVAGCVRPGGYLIYSTCTFNTEENEENVRYIRDELGFEPVSLDLPGTEGVGRSVYEDVDALRFMPYLADGEGLFVAVLRRPVEDEVEERSRRRPVKKNNKQDKRKPARPAWISEDAEVMESGELLTALPKAMLPLLERLVEAGVNVTGAGLPVGVIKGREVQPDSRVVLSTLLNPEAFPIVELTEDEALRYLRREAIVLPEGTSKGYVCVNHKGHPLGLVKNIGSRANNMYPQGWKIRM